MKLECFVRRCRRRNSGLVIEERQAHAKDLISALLRANLAPSEAQLSC
jgi:hypothetical protein